MRLLIIDNYDSFTFNLHQLISEAGCKHIDVIKNNQITIEKASKYDKIVFSPGPGIPSEVPIMNGIISEFQQTKSMLGVCLGHQAIGCFYGAKLMNLPHPHHGISSLIRLTETNDPLFKGIKGNIKVGRYHSWVIDDTSLPSCLTITSISDDGFIMSVAHDQYDIKGLQFHPESYITSAGNQMMQNWLRM